LEKLTMRQARDWHAEVRRERLALFFG